MAAKTRAHHSVRRSCLVLLHSRPTRLSLRAANSQRRSKLIHFFHRPLLTSLLLLLTNALFRRGSLSAFDLICAEVILWVIIQPHTRLWAAPHLDPSLRSSGYGRAPTDGLSSLLRPPVRWLQVQRRYQSSCCHPRLALNLILLFGFAHLFQFTNKPDRANPRLLLIAVSHNPSSGFSPELKVEALTSCFCDTLSISLHHLAAFFRFHKYFPTTPSTAITAIQASSTQARRSQTSSDCNTVASAPDHLVSSSQAAPPLPTPALLLTPQSKISTY